MSHRMIDPSPRGVGVERGHRGLDFLRDIAAVALGLSAALSVYSTRLSLIVGLPLALMAAVLNLPAWRFRATDLLAVVFVGTTASSVWWSVDGRLTEAHTMRLGAAIAMFICFRVATTTTRLTRAAALGFLSGCGVALISLQQQFPDPVLAGFRGAATPMTVEGLNPNYLAYSFAGAAGLLAAMLAGWHRLHFIALTLPLYWGAALTGSRGALLGILTASLWAVLPRRALNRGLKPILVCLVLGWIAVGVGVTDALLRRFFPAQLGIERGDLNGRLTLWPLARDVVLDHPFFGTGAGTFPVFNAQGIYAHHALLDISAGTGMPGALLFLSILCAVIAEAKHSVSPSKSGLVVGAFALALYAPLVSGYWYSAPALWTLLAIWSRCGLLLGARADLEPDERESMDTWPHNSGRVTCISGSAWPGGSGVPGIK